MVGEQRGGHPEVSAVPGLGREGRGRVSEDDMRVLSGEVLLGVHGGLGSGREVPVYEGVKDGKVKKGGGCD